MNLPNTTGSSFKLPLGPVHVALEEPVYFHLTIDGETITKAVLQSGHVHRGMENLAQQRNLIMDQTLTERVCSLCSNSHSFTYAMVVENALGIKISERAKYLRSMTEEIKRMASHLFNIAIQAHLCGYASLFMHTMEVRELMQDVKEAVYGNRMNLAFNCIGGTKHDLDQKCFDFILEQLDKFEPQVEELCDIFENDPMMRERTVGIGVLPKEDALRLGVVGPVARGSGIATDVRKEAPYAAYGKLDFNVITRPEGDLHARTYVRLHEVLESAKIVRQVIRDIPEGPCRVHMKGIHPAAAVARSEAPRGELIYFIRTNNTDVPDRLHWRVPSYPNWEALSVMLKNAKLADAAREKLIRSNPHSDLLGYVFQGLGPAEGEELAFRLLHALGEPPGALNINERNSELVSFKNLVDTLTAPAVDFLVDDAVFLRGKDEIFTHYLILQKRLASNVPEAPCACAPGLRLIDK